MEALKRLGAALVVLVLACGYAFAQPTVRPCVTTGINQCPPVSSANPLPMSAPSPISMGVTNSTGTGQAVIGCDQSVVYDASTNGSTQLVALSGTTTIYVCGYTIFAAGTVNVELDYGTGSACGSGTTKIVPAFQLTAQTGAVDGSPFYRGLKAISANALCLKTSAGTAVQAIVYYAQF